MRDLKAGQTIQIKESKTGKINVLAVNKKTYRTLQNYIRKIQPDDTAPLFPSQKGGGLMENIASMPEGEQFYQKRYGLRGKIRELINEIKIFPPGGDELTPEFKNVNDSGKDLNRGRLLEPFTADTTFLQIHFKNGAAEGIHYAPQDQEVKFRWRITAGNKSVRYLLN